MSWQDLESMMKELLIFDKAMTVPGSGNGKSEEDIIGLSTITQCKYSDKVNISILRKDIDRLLTAAELQKKIPIFVTENNGLVLVSIPTSPILKDVLHMIVGMSLIKFVQLNAIDPKTIDEKREYRKLIIRGENIVSAINGKYQKLALECRMSLSDLEENLQFIKELENEK